MHTTLADVMDTQSRIIKLQGDIIDRLSIELLQRGGIEEEDLRLIEQAAKEREKTNKE